MRPRNKFVSGSLFFTFLWVYCMQCLKSQGSTPIIFTSCLYKQQQTISYRLSAGRKRFALLAAAWVRQHFSLPVAEEWQDITIMVEEVETAPALTCKSSAVACKAFTEMSPHRNEDKTWVSLCGHNRQPGEGPRQAAYLPGCPGKSKGRWQGSPDPWSDSVQITTGGRQALRLSLLGGGRVPPWPHCSVQRVL